MVQPKALGPLRCFTSADGLDVFDDRAPEEIQHMGIVTHLAVMMPNEHHWEGLQTFLSRLPRWPFEEELQNGH